jgi:hypothetical protein
MAGKRQHYVPRLLQRGFLTPSRPGIEMTWLHRRGAKARDVSIRDVGVGEYFYSRLRDDGVATLDELITELEGPLDVEVKQLRDGPQRAVDAQAATRLVMHLTWRTAFLRSVFAQGAGQIVDAMASLMADADALRQRLGVDAAEPVGMVEEVLDAALQKAHVEALGLPPALMRRMLGFLLRENYETFYEQAGPPMVAALRTMLAEMPNQMRDAHNRVLEKEQTDPDRERENKWEADLAAMTWRVQAVTDAILPDCVVLAREAGGDFVPLLLAERETVDLVVLPIAHDRLLVGVVGDDAPVDVALLNLASAASSDSFFITHRPDAHEGLADLIGQRSSQVVRTQVDRALADLRFMTPAAIAEKETVAQVQKTATAEAFTYTFSANGFADEETAHEVNDVLKIVVQEVGRSLALSTLDGVTFAADLPAAVEGLDLGDPDLEPIRIQPRDYGSVVARTIDVLRDGRPKTHIVIHAGLGWQMLSEDRHEQVMAIHVLVSQLADLAHRATFGAQLEGKWATPADEVLRCFYRSASAAPGLYYSARESAFIDPAGGERYAGLVRDSLAAARTGVDQAKAAFLEDQDMDKMLNDILPRISHVIGHAAEWLGHRDGLPEQDDFPGSILRDELRSEDLYGWVEVLGRDLRNLHDVQDQFTPANIFALGRHVERLLWPMLVFAWPLDDGSPYISVFRPPSETTPIAIEVDA